MSNAMIDRKRTSKMMILLNKNHGEIENSNKQVEEIVKTIETRERKKFSTSKRQLALALHRQADQLHKKLLPGDYEPALVLYHRAARLNPQNLSHFTAVKRTSSCLSPSRKKNPSTVAIHPVKSVFHTSPRVPSPPPKTSGEFFRSSDQRDLQARGLSLSTCKILTVLKKSFNDNNYVRTIEIGTEILERFHIGLNDWTYQIAVHRYLSLAYLSLGRHDEAVNYSVKMITLAKRSNDIKLQIRSFAVFGKVHLSFGHLNAAAVGWTDLLKLLEHAIPRAWLLHEIARCHYEMGNWLKALEISRRSWNWAEEGNSNKWIYHSKLLGGQALVLLGRFTEGMEALRCAFNVAKIEGDVSMADYIENLIDRVAEAMRSRMKTDKKCMTEMPGVGSIDDVKQVGRLDRQLTSRTRVIQSDDQNEDKYKFSGEIDWEMGSCIIDKWKKYLNQSKKQCDEVGLPEGNVDKEVTYEVDGEKSSDEEKRSEYDSGSLVKSCGIETDRLYRCFIGSGKESDR